MQNRIPGGHMKVNGRMVVKIVVACLIVGAIAIGAAYFLKLAKIKYVPSAPEQDLTNHPIYKSYDFSKAENIINVGVQPLWVPTNVITEVMRHDLILKKALAGQGLELRFYSFLKGSDINYFLERGDLDAGIGGDMPALAAAARSDILITSLAQYGFCAIVAETQLGINDLCGKRIGCAFGSTTHHTLMYALSFSGLGDDDVKIVYMDVNEMPDALNEGQIDAFIAWEPTPTIALQRFPKQRVVHRGLCSGFLYFSQSFAKKHPKAMRDIVASEVRAILWLGESDTNLLKASEWALRVVEKLEGKPQNLSVAQLSELAKKDMLGLFQLPTVPKSDLQKGGRLYEEFVFLQKLGLISETADWKKVRASFDRSILQNVISQSRHDSRKIFEYEDVLEEAHEAQ